MVYLLWMELNRQRDFHFGKNLIKNKQKQINNFLRQRWENQIKNQTCILSMKLAIDNSSLKNFKQKLLKKWMIQTALSQQQYKKIRRNYLIPNISTIQTISNKCNRQNYFKSKMRNRAEIWQRKYSKELKTCQIRCRVGIYE